MAELKRIWLVTDSNITPAEFMSDPALLKQNGSFDEEAALAQFCDPKGYTPENLINVIVGGGMSRSIYKTNPAFHSDQASAMADAKKRFNELKKKAGKATKKQAYSYQRV